MSDPCKECIVLPCCSVLCREEVFYRANLDNEVKKNRRFIYSKNGRRRKRLSDRKLVHYNRLVDKWNKHLIISEKICDREQDLWNQLTNRLNIK